ncbi:hypothetical protein [Tahibacter sp.]|uniref:hypothetical protein n=1 Tax=Tahibacter sp. TaxID=2056211 RepID=UPI0028C3E14F|nr:hypothetical protein [Tahibacter sp.]
MTLTFTPFESFCEASREQKALVLARLLRALGVVGRETYVPGEDGLSDPARLRRLNELSHRIANKLVEVLAASDTGMPDATFLQFLALALEEVEIHPDTLESLMSMKRASE